MESPVDTPMETSSDSHRVYADILEWNHSPWNTLKELGRGGEDVQGFIDKAQMKSSPSAKGICEVSNNCAPALASVPGAPLCTTVQQ